MILAVDRLVPSFSVTSDGEKGNVQHTHTQTHTDSVPTRGRAQTLPLIDETVLTLLSGLFREHPISPRAGEAAVTMTVRL